MCDDSFINFKKIILELNNNPVKTKMLHNSLVFPLSYIQIKKVLYFSRPYVKNVAYYGTSYFWSIYWIHNLKQPREYFYFVLLRLYTFLQVKNSSSRTWNAETTNAFHLGKESGKFIEYTAHLVLQNLEPK